MGRRGTTARWQQAVLKLGSPRLGHSATKLDDGRVLVCGGGLAVPAERLDVCDFEDPCSLASAEVVDPDSMTAVPVAPMPEPPARARGVVHDLDRGARPSLPSGLRMRRGSEDRHRAGAPSAATLVAFALLCLLSATVVDVGTGAPFAYRDRMFVRACSGLQVEEAIDPALSAAPLPAAR